MSNDGPMKPAQRFSRYSRASYEDVAPLPPQQDEPSLTELTQRALNGERIPRRPGPRGKDLSGFPENGAGETLAPVNVDQPPPPETQVWDDETPYEENRNGTSRIRRTKYREMVGPPVADPMHEARSDIEPAAVELEKSANRDATAHKRADMLGSGTLQAASSTRERKRKARKENSRKRMDAVKASARSARAKAIPALMNSGLWLAKNLRRREIRRRYNRLLVFGHTRVGDRKLEPLFFVPTRKAEVIDPAPARGIHYDGPVPSKAFDWVMSVMPGDLREFAFIDVRAGRGRTSLLAAKHNFKQIIAYEYDPETFDDLQMNIAQYPRSRMVCRNIDAHRGDVDGIVMPDRPCIVYFSNAWREPMIEGVIDYVSGTYRQSPRRIYVILENVAADTALSQNNLFDLIEPPLAQRVKLRLFSPMDFRIYRSVA